MRAFTLTSVYFNVWGLFLMLKEEFAWQENLPMADFSYSDL